MATPLEEKYTKLVLEYGKLKTNNSLLKKGLLQEKEKTTQSEQTLKENNENLRQQQTEIERLEFENKKLFKRVENLQETLKEKEKTTSSWNILSRSSSVNIPDKKDEELKLLREELSRKIEQHETINLKMSDMEKEYEKTIKLYQEKINSMKKNIQETEEMTEKKIQQHLKEKIKMESEILELKNKVLKSNDFIEKLQEETRKREHITSYQTQELKQKLLNYENNFIHKIHFDDSLNSKFNQLNIIPHSSDFLNFQRECLSNILLLFKNQIQASNEWKNSAEKIILNFPKFEKNLNSTLENIEKFFLNFGNSKEIEVQVKEDLQICLNAIIENNNLFFKEFSNLLKEEPSEKNFGANEKVVKLNFQIISQFFEIFNFFEKIIKKSFSLLENQSLILHEDSEIKEILSNVVQLQSHFKELENLTSSKFEILHENPYYIPSLKLLDNSSIDIISKINESFGAGITPLEKICLTKPPKHWVKGSSVEENRNFQEIINSKAFQYQKNISNLLNNFEPIPFQESISNLKLISQLRLQIKNFQQTLQEQKENFEQTKNEKKLLSLKVNELGKELSDIQNQKSGLLEKILILNKELENLKSPSFQKDKQNENQLKFQTKKIEKKKKEKRSEDLIDFGEEEENENNEDFENDEQQEEKNENESEKIDLSINSNSIISSNSSSNSSSDFQFTIVDEEGNPSRGLKVTEEMKKREEQIREFYTNKMNQIVKQAKLVDERFLKLYKFYCDLLSKK